MPRVTRRRTTQAAWSTTERWPSVFAGEMLASLNRATGAGLHSLQVSPSGPPCYVCANAAGARVALEVDALVCNKPARGNPLQRVLHAGALAAHVARLLARKDAETYEGGPYAEVAAVLVNDDPSLTLEQAVFGLSSVAFGPYRQIGSAYLLLAYDSSTMSCPAVPIRLKR